MKKIIVMGGGINQIPLVEASKQLGYYTIICDEAENTIGKSMCDEYINIDISDADLVVKKCKEKKVDGIVCNTESVMEVLASVQSEMGFLGNSLFAIKNLGDKFLFRKIQKKANMFAPCTEHFSTYEDAKSYIDKRKQKQIIKPEMSSGSRGVMTIEKNRTLEEKDFKNCIKYSRNNQILIEDFVEYDLDAAYEAEVFVLNGNLEFVFLFRTIRDRKYNILPQCYCSDTKIDWSEEKKIRDILQRIFKEAKIVWGEYNVELAFIENEVFVIEINARQGGMMLPGFVKLFSGVDLNKLLVSTAVGDMDYYSVVKKTGYEIDKNCIHFRILADDIGTYDGYEINKNLRKMIVKEFEYISSGEIVDPQEGGYISVALIDIKYPENYISSIEREIFEAVKVKISKK